MPGMVLSYQILIKNKYFIICFCFKPFQVSLFFPLAAGLSGKMVLLCLLLGKICHSQPAFPWQKNIRLFFLISLKQQEKFQ